MRVTQGYVSKSVNDFPFLRQMGLTEYIDSIRPMVFFGCYSNEDVQIISNHKSKKIIFWCGQDAIDCIFFGRYQYLQDCIHVSHMVNVVKILKPFLDIQLIAPLSLGGTFIPSPLGNKIFLYAPASHPSYHKAELIEQLSERVPFEFIIGDGSVSQYVWLNGHGGKVYDECFIGLCLSGFAGGGQTIIQLGLKGRKAVTNCLNLPNCVNWRTIDDIVFAISNEAAKIGSENKELSKQMNDLIDNHNWLELDNYK